MYYYNPFFLLEEITLQGKNKNKNKKNFIFKRIMEVINPSTGRVQCNHNEILNFRGYLVSWKKMMFFCFHFLFLVGPPHKQHKEETNKTS